MANWIAAALLGPVLNGVLAGTAVAGLVWLLLRAFPRATATMRYAVWMAALLAVVSLPVLMFQVPGDAAQGAAGEALARSGPLLTLPAPGRLAVWFLGLWAVAGSALLLRLAFSYRSVLGLKRRARALGGRPLQQFQEVLSAYAGRRRVRLCATGETGIPMAAGLWNPVILIPESLPEELSENEFRQVLVHELAHIRRWDDWTNLVQKIAEAVFFFNPAVLWIGRRLNLEREIACDDWVVSMTGEARPYAACLTRLVELGAFSRGPQLVNGAVARKRQISYRIESLLSRKRAASPRLSPVGVLASSGGLAVAALLAAHVAPIAVAEPAIAALPSAAMRIQAAEVAYAVPPPAPPPVRHAAPKTVLQAAAGKPAATAWPQTAVVAEAPPMPTVRYTVVEQWTVVRSHDQAAALCVLYVGQDANGTGERTWVRILLTHPEPSRMPDGRI
jgi:beta-lactamase regulating signal transducer with metallopeptidase domain